MRATHRDTLVMRRSRGGLRRVRFTRFLIHRPAGVRAAKSPDDDVHQETFSPSVVSGPITQAGRFRKLVNGMLAARILSPG
jgi:hypothetical protein